MSLSLCVIKVSESSYRQKLQLEGALLLLLVVVVVLKGKGSFAYKPVEILT